MECKIEDEEKSHIKEEIKVEKIEIDDELEENSDNQVKVINLILISIERMVGTSRPLPAERGLDEAG